jgi:hypothetical protein
MLAAVNTVLLRLLPGAVLLLALAVALHSVRLRAVVWPLLPAYPLVVLGAGILLAWRFDRSRLVFTLAILLLADRALLLWAPVDGSGADVGRVVFGALAILLPWISRRWPGCPSADCSRGPDRWRWPCSARRSS